MKNSLRDKIRKIIEESVSPEAGEQTPTIDLSNVVSSNLVNNKFLKIIFKNSNEQNLCLIVPVTAFTGWYDSSKPSGNVLQKFITEFVKSPSVEDDSLINEIVDEFGDLIGDDDMGNNSTNNMVGNSVFGTDKTIRQTVPKIKTYDSNLGRGMVTW